MKDIINNMFNSIEYWQDKKLLLRAIRPDYYTNKNLIIQLLKINSASVSLENEAKKDMWNHQIVDYSLGDDILKNVHPDILNDLDFARQAIDRYNRTYIYLSKNLKASHELAKQAASQEKEFSQNQYHHLPILHFMPEVFQTDHEISLIATTRNIENMQYAPNLRRNKYFIIDIMNLLDDNALKQKVLKYINQDLLLDKLFISKLGCFDNLCEKFHNDIEYVANAVRHDINILKKTKIFDEQILKAALLNDDFYTSKYKILSDIFRYIEKFNSNYDELNQKIKDKSILKKLFWNFGETISEEYI